MQTFTYGKQPPGKPDSDTDPEVGDNAGKARHAVSKDKNGKGRTSRQEHAGSGENNLEDLRGKRETPMLEDAGATAWKG